LPRFWLTVLFILSSQLHLRWSTILKAQYEALGRFVEAFEAMVDDVREICTGLISYGLKSATANDSLMEIAFHHQVMTAKPLYNIMRAIIAEIVSKPNDFHFDDREHIKDLLSFIEVAYSHLLNKRNELLHGTWFIGYPTGTDQFANEFHLKKFKVTSDGLRGAKELPKNAEELLDLAKRCNTTRTWIGHIDYCIIEKHRLKNFFKCEGIKDKRTWYFRYFPDRDDWTTLPRK
jgi:hypothetical protein